MNYQTLCLCDNSGLGFDHLRYHAQTHPINADNRLSLARYELSFRTGGDQWGHLARQKGCPVLS